MGLLCQLDISYTYFTAAAFGIYALSQLHLTKKRRGTKFDKSYQSNYLLLTGG
ncbi:hypothetical protein PROFUN_03043 [Planoprotostelium fungivorum]|uniref:Uncharacterized protein n=1 Tax=Planoprotostelium fungivorum TaxID=1890364 RepID=A0A2P6NXE6_9EUKA|nr:hypothetical protein PROFUN_03043 [Planoprotostelium fungivorum]